MTRINLTKRIVAALGLSLMLAAAPVALAQEAAPPLDPAPADAGTATSSTANDPGSIDTSKQVTTTTTTTHTNSGGYQVTESDAPLPNTGGEPLLFVLAGSMLIGGGWVLRRKMAQSES